MSPFDLAIIGAGPGGYVAAIRAAQLGAKVALIERGEVGGVCLNRGCIPSKALIASAHAVGEAGRAAAFGVVLEGSPSIDMGRVQARKNAIISTLREGVSKLLKGNGVELIRGTASFTAPGKVAVDGAAVDAKNVLIATGSFWIELPNIKVDGSAVVTSDEALDWTSVPRRLIIVGGGVIGCEFACMMRAFGAEVTIVEATPSILPPVEKAISRLLARQMKSKGIEIVTDTMVASAVPEGDEVKISLSNGENRAADKVLVCVGRRPETAGLNVAAAGIELDKRGFIKVDSRFKTSADGVFAIGDVIGNPMLAHAASAEGIAAVEGMFRNAEYGIRNAEYDPASCPSPIFTSPEIAAVGLTSEELEKRGQEFKTGRFPYLASGKALCDGEPEGQAIVHAAADGKILGVHVIGREAALLIAEAALAMKNGLTVKDIASSIHSHPTLSEIMAEACEDVDGMAIHKAKAKRETK